jgi:hypothetical protein
VRVDDAHPYSSQVDTDAKEDAVKFLLLLQETPTPKPRFRATSG